MTHHMISVTNHSVHIYIWKIIIWHLYILQSEHHLKSITIHLTSSTHFAHSQPLSLLVNTSLIPLSLFSLLCFVFWNSTYEWNHMIFAFVWLISLRIIPSRSIHIVANGRISFFLWLSSIPLCLCTTSLSNHPSKDT